MKPLKIAILWHQHQPYYKKENEFILPWVRMHGVKDYFDLAEILNEYPSVKQTFNMVPSMLLQLEEYISSKCKDKIQRLTEIPAENLTADDKNAILESFFLCNEPNMIFPYKRYNELFEKSRDKDFALSNFAERDWRDLQVWYNLTWFGPLARQKASVRRLFLKEHDFTEGEKMLMLNLHLEVLRQIVPTLLELKKLNQIEISCSPMYHPILPLLVGSSSMHEAMAEAKLPEPLFEHPEDAQYQIESGIRYFESTFGFKPNGMWPSEGSVSDAVLSLISKNGIKWLASDEMILANSLKSDYFHLDKYFPRRIKTAEGELAMFFRDHQLSDAIGFTYSNWYFVDAVNDYMNKLGEVKQSLIQKYGEDCLSKAVVPIILDGENCWEFYPDNGINFLKELYKRLSETDEFQTITMSEALTEESLNFLPVVNHLRAGSWINADFNIWMGHREHVVAWEMLGRVRSAVEERKSDISAELYKEAMNEIYIAEGSDWFWWYGDSHFAPNKYDFDDLFRWHIEKIYKLLVLEPPANVFFPINEVRQVSSIVQPKGEINPPVNGNLKNNDYWENAGNYDAKSAMSAMHQLGEILQSVRFGSNGKLLFLRINFLKALAENEFLTLNFENISVTIRQNGFELNCLNNISVKNILYSSEDFAVLAISTDVFPTNQTIGLTIFTKTAEGEITYPRQGKIELNGLR